MTSSDPRSKESPPPVAIGHVTLRVADVTVAAGFYGALGLRPIMNRAELAILELRGGTHLLLFKAKRKPKAGPIRSFDLMVDDITSTRASLEEAGVRMTPIKEDRLSGHQMFELTDPDGRTITILSSHTGGRRV